MLLAAGLFLTFGVLSISALLITASDLPECAVECYCLAGAKASIPVTEYERQCRSAPFQTHLRECAKKACTEEEFGFTEFHAKEYCSQFGVNTDQVLMEYKSPAPTQKSTEEISGTGDQVELDGENTESANISPTTCTKCKTPRIATSTAEAMTDVTQSVSIISTGNASSTASASKSGAVGEVHRTWFSAIVGLFALGWIL